jgi:hypothetical protein
MCREKTAFPFPVERIENKSKHITSRQVRTNNSEEKVVVNKKQFILFSDMLKTAKLVF